MRKALKEANPSGDIVKETLEIEMAVLDPELAAKCAAFQTLLREIPTESSAKKAAKYAIKSFKVRPNKYVGVRRVTTEGPLKGQLEAFARVQLNKGHLVPFPGVICETGRPNYDVSIDRGSWAGYVFDPDIRCSGTYVNDFGGPARLSWNMKKAEKKQEEIQNVKFTVSSPPYHIWWRVIKPIEPGEALLGDYGKQYWEVWEDHSTET